MDLPDWSQTPYREWIKDYNDYVERLGPDGVLSRINALEKGASKNLAKTRAVIAYATEILDETQAVLLQMRKEMEAIEPSARALQAETETAWVELKTYDRCRVRPSILLAIFRHSLFKEKDQAQEAERTKILNRCFGGKHALEGFREFQLAIKEAESTVRRMKKAKAHYSKKVFALENAEQRRAIIARAEGKARNAAEAVKTALAKTQRCPYCQEPLDGACHADHIVPIAMGGLSVEHNMVQVCPGCNLSKSDKTLREFCLSNRFDFDAIADRLTAIGKRV